MSWSIIKIRLTLGLLVSFEWQECLLNFFYILSEDKAPLKEIPDHSKHVITRRGRPVDSRPSTNELHNFVRKIYNFFFYK